MRRHRRLWSLLAAVACAASCAALPQAATPPAPPAISAATSVLDPTMVDPLDRMGLRLAGLTSFERGANTTVRFLLEIDRTIEIDGRARYLAWQPDKPRTRHAPRFHGHSVEFLDGAPPG
ncbi:hypothetical protein [Methylobacterium oxalidis]|nr:hypothetical protein [Methylobacterium oxalidis]